MTENKLTDGSYALVLTDQSMFPRFEENTLILIDRKAKPKNGDYVVIYIHKNNEILFRQLAEKNKQCFLQPLTFNGYQSILMTKKDIICGVMVEARWTF